MTTSGREKRRRARAVVALVAGIGGVAGCASVLGIESDRHLEAVPDTGVPTTTTDAGTSDAPTSTSPGIDAASLPTNWTCLADSVPAAPSGTVKLEIFFNDVSGGSSSTTGTPVPGMVVHYCDQLDIPNCQHPSADVLTDDAGVAHLTVPGGFDGYYEAISDAGYTPAVLSRTPALSDEYSSQGVANISLLSAGAQLAGLSQDPSLSIAIVTAADCTTTPAAGITFTVEAPGPSEQVVYLVNNYPKTGATATDLASGSALIFNVPPGTLTLTANFATDGGQAIRTVSTIARQGWVTFVQIRPDQATHSPLQ